MVQSRRMQQSTAIASDRPSSSWKHEKGGMSMSFQTDVPVPAACVWEVVKDISNLAQFVDAVERVNFFGEELRVGSQWIEDRRVCKRGSKKSTQQVKTVLKLEDTKDVYPKCLNLLVAFRGDRNDITSTNTWTVQALDDKHSVLILSLAFQAAPFSILVLRLCQRIFIPRIKAQCREELEDYAMEAKKRYNTA